MIFGSCYNQLQKCWDTSTKNQPFLLQITASHTSVDIHSPPSSRPFRVVPPSFEHGLVMLATLMRGGERITSTRSWTGHLSQNMVLLQLFVAMPCNWCNRLKPNTLLKLLLRSTEHNPYPIFKGDFPFSLVIAAVAWGENDSKCLLKKFLILHLKVWFSYNPPHRPSRPNSLKCVKVIETIKTRRKC